MRSTPCWFLMGSMAAALAGCATVGERPNLPPDEVAVLVVGKSDNVVISLIDRAPPPQGLNTVYRYELGPGEHTLILSWDDAHGSLHFYAEAGHTYRLRRKIHRAEQTVTVSADDAGIIQPDNRTSGEASALDSSCQLGQGADCVKLGVLYENGSSATGWDEVRAAQLYTRACDLQVPLGCNHLGELYQQGHGVGEEMGGALALFRRACEGGEGHGCNNRGLLYAEGRGVMKDEHAASQWYERGCKSGYATACYNLGIAYLNGTGVEQDQGVATRWLKKACEDGEGSGCYKLAVLAAQKEARAGSREAVALYEKACERGEPQGCIDLGLLYEDGVGVRQDERRAAALYEKACAAGAAVGCAHLGVLYQLGMGVDEDPGRAAKLLTKACRGGAEAACLGLTVVKKPGKP